MQPHLTQSIMQLRREVSNFIIHKTTPPLPPFHLRLTHCHKAPLRSVRRMAMLQDWLVRQGLCEKRSHHRRRRRGRRRGGLRTFIYLEGAPVSPRSNERTNRGPGEQPQSPVRHLPLSNPFTSAKLTKRLRKATSTANTTVIGYFCSLTLQRYRTANC